MPKELQLDIFVVAALWLALVVLLFCTLTGRIKLRHPLLNVVITLGIAGLSYPLFKLTGFCLRTQVDCVPDSILPDRITQFATRSLGFLFRALHLR